MRQAVRVALLVSALLLVASFAACFFGVQHEIDRLPADHPARRGDTDWIGADWIARAMATQAVAFALSVAAAVAWAFSRRRAGVKSVSR